ncbi:Secreted protein OS=Streptomyces griseomycini OX=66895 GN=FHS37_000552 PE=4 SV=1 [Streptomyces griseomycini]
MSGDERSAPAEKEKEQPSEPADDGPSLGLAAGIAVVVCLGAAAVWQVRRRG